MDNVTIDHEQVERNRQQEERQQVHTHLNTLHKWDLNDGRPVEQHREEHRTQIIRDMTKNESFRKIWSEKKQSLQAEGTAEGNIGLVQTPAKKTYKQRRADAKLDKSAKKLSWHADHVSAHMSESLRENLQEKENSDALITPELAEQAQTNRVDPRILMSYFHGYKKKADGEPVNDTEASFRNADQQMIEAFVTRDLESRRPHLDRIVDMVLAINITEDMLSEEYLEYHMGSVNEALNRLLSFQNLMDDPVNKAYFDELPKRTKDLLRIRVLDRYSEYGDVLARIAAIKSVDLTEGHIKNDGRDQSDVDEEKNMLATARETLKSCLKSTRSEEREMIDQDYQQMYKIEYERRQKTIGSYVYNQAVDDSELGLTSYVGKEQRKVLATYRKMIEVRSQAYMQKKDFIDAMYQELYRTVDASGDLRLRSESAEAVYKKLEGRADLNEAERLVMRRAMLEKEDADAEAMLLDKHVSAIANALSYLLIDEKKSVSDQAQIVISQAQLASVAKKLGYKPNGEKIS